MIPYKCLKTLSGTTCYVTTDVPNTSVQKLVHIDIL